jgi:tRNA1Val (adenine37-N6)-methyltransferase
MSIFEFRHFKIQQKKGVFKIGTDALVLGAFVSQEKSNPRSILDIGCGTGVLSLILAFSNAEAKITCIDINSTAADLTKHNFFLNDIDNKRTDVVNDSFLNYDFATDFDLITCNPPYFSNDLKNIEADKSLARHDDELNSYDLFAKVSGLLNEKGAFWLIYPSDERKNLSKIGEEYGLYPERIIHIYGKAGKKIRYIYKFVKQSNEPVKEEDFLIRDIDGNYSKQYVDLTKELHNRDLLSNNYSE